MRTSYDVTIIGAGLAGLQCARLLARQGLNVLLVDRKNTLDQKIHTTGIFVRRTLVDFDIPDDCLGPPIKHVTLYSPAHRSLELVSRYDEFRIGRMGQLYQRYLQQCLHSGVDWLPQTSYLGHTVENGKVTVQLNTSHSRANSNAAGTDSRSQANSNSPGPNSHSHRASARWSPQANGANRFNGFAPGSSTHSIATRYLIGADGARSRVARDLNLEQNREWIVGVESVLHGAVLDGPPRLLCFLDPKLAPGYIAWIAHDGEETHLGVGGYSSLFDPMPALQDFRSRVTNIIDLRNAKQIEARAGFIPVGGVLRNIANSTGMLIGDAAGAVSPLTAGGLDPCMRLSAFAAKVVTEYLSTGDAQALQTYSGELFRSRFASRLWARRIAATVRQPQLLELGCAVLRLPLFSRLAHHVFFGRGSFPDVADIASPLKDEVATPATDHV